MFKAGGSRIGLSSFTNNTENIELKSLRTFNKIMIYLLKLIPEAFLIRLALITIDLNCKFKN